ncbi:MAG: ISL3 family transposase [Marinifilaceae bacterium]
MENSKEIFSIALGLVSPWAVESISFEETETGKELHIYLSFTKGSKFKGDDKIDYTAHDTVKRTWQHLNFFQHECYLHARVPRIKENSGKITTVQVPWARKGSGFTLLFEAYSMLLIESEMPVKKAANIMGVYPQRIWNIFSYWISKAHKEDKIKDLSKVGFDETSSKKGHSYVTTLVDLETRRVLYVTKGKGAETINNSVEYLKDKSVDVQDIKQVCIDMSPSFISGCKAHLPNAAVTFDKFHVLKEVYSAMDELRRLERIGNDMLKGHKYTFLKNKISQELHDKRNELMDLYPKLGEGFRLVQLFKEFWNINDKDDAQAYLSYWCDITLESNIFPFRKAVKMIKSHWSGIVNYIESKISNGILEGINSKIQLAKKRARGYRNIDNFINMIYFTCGKLKFDYPLYSI